VVRLCALGGVWGRRRAHSLRSVRALRTCRRDAVAEPLLRTEFEGVKLLARGKVRDIYDLDSQLLIVATDRISAFDVVMPNGIPDKGRVLTQMS
jgi:phosphoribosylaminoimidazole-succinocarboxamide synthase